MTTSSSTRAPGNRFWRRGWRRRVAEAVRRWDTNLKSLAIRYGPAANEAFAPIAEVVTIGAVASWVALGPCGTIIFVASLGVVRYWAYQHRQTRPDNQVEPVDSNPPTEPCTACGK